MTTASDDTDLLPLDNLQTNFNTTEYGRIVSLILHKNRVEVVTRLYSTTILLCNPPRPAPDKIMKWIYEFRDGKFDLIAEITGKHTPASTMDERIEFPEPSDAPPNS